MATLKEKIAALAESLKGDWNQDDNSKKDFMVTFGNMHKTTRRNE